MSGKRILILACLIVGVMLGLFWPLLSSNHSPPPAPTGDSFTVSLYTGDLTVADDGNLIVSETLNADFTSGGHGITRYFAVADPADPHIRRIPIISSVTRDGSPEPYTTTWQGADRYFVLQTGTATTIVPSGSHTYVISYTMPATISPGTAGSGQAFESTAGATSDSVDVPGSVFFWDVVAPTWQQYLSAVVVRVTLPSPSRQVQCIAGTESMGRASLGPCTIDGAGGRTLNLASGSMPPSSGMIVRATMAPPPPPQPGAMTLPWSVGWDPILGRSTPTLLLVLALAVALFFASRYWVRRTIEPESRIPGNPVLPEGIGPAQSVYLAHQHFDANVLPATLLHMADRGLISVQTRSPGSWLITSRVTVSEWAAADPAARAVAAELGIDSGEDFWFLLEKTQTCGAGLQAARTKLQKGVTKWAAEEDYVVRAPSQRWAQFVWVAAVVLTVVAFIGPYLRVAGTSWPTVFGLPFAALVLGGFDLIRPGIGTRRTVSGRDVQARSLGLQRMLSAASSEPLDYGPDDRVFLEYVPYAVAFGVVDHWATRYRRDTGEEPPKPGWYPAGTAGADCYADGRGFGDFTATLSSAVFAFRATQPSQ